MAASGAGHLHSRRLSLIVMMQPTHCWDFLDRSHLRPLNQLRYRTIHGQRPVRAPVLVILEIPGEQLSQMSLVQDHRVVQTRATDTPDEPLDRGILPQTSWGDEHFSHAPVPHPLPKDDELCG
jgi:hypothetical protein